MEVGPTWMLTGSADEEVRVWSIIHRSEKSVAVDTVLRLIGHEVPVTCVRYGKLEVVSGDALGRIFIWWLETGEVLRQCHVHKGPVRCLQFDATRIVSGGSDTLVCITDIGSGDPLQSLRSHTKPVLAVAFDTERIISVSVDNTIKYWEWGKKTGPQDKLHVLGKEETLVDVSKIFNVPISDLMKWNGLNSLKQCYAGMQLIVTKGDPTKLTQSEEAAIERERRRALGLAYSKKKMQVTKDEDTLKKYDRIHRLATDADTFSMGNRMFKETKHATELFPDSHTNHKDMQSLASRLTTTKDMNHIPSKFNVIISPENEEEWGPVADSLGIAMLELYVEFAAYEVAKEEKSVKKDTRSFGGRVKAYIQNGQTSPKSWEVNINKRRQRSKTKKNDNSNKLKEELQSSEQLEENNNVLPAINSPVQYKDNDGGSVGVIQPQRRSSSSTTHLPKIDEGIE